MTIGVEWGTAVAVTVRLVKGTPLTIGSPVSLLLGVLLFGASRNVVAHMNPLQKRDVDRISLNAEDGFAQIKGREPSSVPKVASRA